jgi:hypothetical protein
MYLRASSKRRADVSVFTRVLRASEKVGQGCCTILRAARRHVPQDTTTRRAEESIMATGVTDAAADDVQERPGAPCRRKEE